MAGITLDTGVLIGLERRQRSILVKWESWLEAKAAVTVPAVVVAEWWRGQRGPSG
ncbi:MAG TPA: hypothetical protein VGP93_11760 [Polyangiaceae bacterium]|jgi:predicted nucleic acid-binding protein|nr:hypothetical protein [Polyangiaceae bacterium]